MRGQDSVLCTLLVSLQNSACHGNHDNVRDQVTPHNQVRPGSVAEWELIEGENVGEVKEGWPQQTNQETKRGVGDKQHSLCSANGLAKGCGVHRKADDWDHDLTKPHAPTHRQGWVLQPHQQRVLIFRQTEATTLTQNPRTVQA